MQSHVLIDASQGTDASGAVFESSTSGGKAAKWNVRLRTCHGGPSEGVHVVEINNGAITIDVLPTRGMGIWRVRRGDRTLGWTAPASQPVHPVYVPLLEPSGLGWLDGFNELLCRCGLESNGPPEFDDAGRLLRPLHGRIANTPARYVELSVDEDSGTITLRGVIEEARLFFRHLRLTTEIVTEFGSHEFTWRDKVENVSATATTMQMLYHFNVGHPLLKPGTRVEAPIAQVAPKTKVAAEEGIDTWNVMPPSRPTSSEQVYLADLAADDEGNTGIFLSGLLDNDAVSLRFNKRNLPCFTLWRSSLAEQDGYVMGLEPATNYPNSRTFEEKHGRVVALEPGEKWHAQVAVGWYEGGAGGDVQLEKIRQFQEGSVPALLHAPPNGWTEGF